MLPPKLGHILGCLAFSEFFFSHKNKTLSRPNHLLKIQLEIHFFTFLNTDRNAPKKILNSNYIVLYEKTAFKTDFGLWEVPQPENA